MILIAVFLLLLFALAVMFVWLADNPGTVTLEWPWLGSVVELSLLQAVIAIAIVVVAFTLLWLIVDAMIKSPKIFGRWQRNRRRDRGYKALSRGLVAAGAGDAALARRLTGESRKLLDDEPLVAMLDAQTALMEGNRTEARKQFETMLENDDTRLLGLRGLYVEAEQEGAVEAAAYFAKQAHGQSPSTPWASKAMLKSQTLTGQWEEALRTLGATSSKGLFAKDEQARKRAVLLTAQALSEEDSDPQKSKSHALAAIKAAPDLVPAALVAARTAVRTDDIRRAGKVLEAAWKTAPHPEIGEAYVELRSGDSAKERLKRAQTLTKKHGDDPIAKMLIGQAALDAQEFSTARDAMEQVLQSRPTERACILMAEIEEAEYGDQGRMREWLARAVTAPKDPMWIADGVTSETWAPLSPVTGKLDAFEWKAPMDQIGGPSVSTDYSLLVKAPLPEPEPEDVDDKLVDITPASATDAGDQQEAKDDVTAQDDPPVEDAEIIELTANDNQTEAKDDAATSDGDRAAKGDETPGTQSDEEDAKKDDAKTADAKTAEAKAGDGQKSSNPASPFKSAELDTDEDGVLDRRPDDPGTEGDDAGDGKKAKKGLFF